ARRRDLGVLRADLVLARRQPGHLQLARELAHPRGLDGVVGAGIVELGARDAADFELGLVALELLRGLRFRRDRLGELRPGQVELWIALAELQIGELGLGGLELLVGLPLGRRFLIGLQLEERRTRVDRLPALHEEAFEPAADGRGDVYVFALDIALVGGRLVCGATAENSRSDEEYERVTAHEPLYLSHLSGHAKVRRDWTV